MRTAEMPADPHGVSFSRTKDIVKTIENLVEVKLTTKITEKSAVILTLNFDVFYSAFCPLRADTHHHGFLPLSCAAIASFSNRYSICIPVTRSAFSRSFS